MRRKSEMTLKEYRRYKTKLATAKRAIIEDLIALLGERVIAAVAQPQMSFLHTVNSSRINGGWSVAVLMNGGGEDRDVNNLRLVLEASHDVVKTLSRIVEFGNVSNKYKGDGGYSFFRKVKPEHLEIIKRYLGDYFIASGTGVEKRNLSSRRN